MSKRLLAHRADANPLLIPVLAVVAAIWLVYQVGHEVWTDHFLSKAATACEQAKDDPIFRSAPTSREDKEALGKLYQSITIFKKYSNASNCGPDQGTFDLCFTSGPYNSFKSCLSELENRYNQYIPFSTENNPASSAVKAGKGN